MRMGIATTIGRILPPHLGFVKRKAGQTGKFCGKVTGREVTVRVEGAPGGRPGAERLWFFGYDADGRRQAVESGGSLRDPFEKTSGRV